VNLDPLTVFVAILIAVLFGLATGWTLAAAGIL
jgi:hypothetical protein